MTADKVCFAAADDADADDAQPTQGRTLLPFADRLLLQTKLHK